jgi:hypothetical protein
MENETSSDKLFRLAQLDEQIKTLVGESERLQQRLMYSMLTLEQTKQVQEARRLVEGKIGLVRNDRNLLLSN